MSEEDAPVIQPHQPGAVVDDQQPYVPPPGPEAFAPVDDGRRPPAATGPAGVSTTQDIVGRQPHRGVPQRELVLDNDTYGKLEQAVEDLDGTAVRRVAGGGLDLSGMVVRAVRDARAPQPGGYGRGMRGGEL